MLQINFRGLHIALHLYECESVIRACLIDSFELPIRLLLSDVTHLRNATVVDRLGCAEEDHELVHILWERELRYLPQLY